MAAADYAVVCSILGEAVLFQEGIAGCDSNGCTLHLADVCLLRQVLADDNNEWANL
jgi:hypothetical protein